MRFLLQSHRGPSARGVRWVRESIALVWRFVLRAYRRGRSEGWEGLGTHVSLRGSIQTGWSYSRRVRRNKVEAIKTTGRMLVWAT